MQKLKSTLVSLILVVPFLAGGSENIARVPYGQLADLPEPGQLRAGLHYQESEAYYIWDNQNRYSVDWHAHGEHYGIDINQGYVSFDYGINDRWAADLTIGATTVGWRYFSNFSSTGVPQSTTGLMDTPFGVRYQIFKEGEYNCRWTPTLAFRAGAILPGSFDEHLPFAPGTSSAAIEPSLIARKHFGWTGFGGYADGLFRWNKTSANDLYIVSFGLFQQVQGWELDAGYRHLGGTSGETIRFDPNTRLIDYPRAPRESSDAIDAGFHYTTKKKQIKIGFDSRAVFDGNSTDKKFWVGGFIEVPLQIRKTTDE